MGRKKLLPNRDDIILDAAEQLFAARSYEKTTLDEIAQRAGISKGSIYLEFPSKEEILYSLIQRNKDAELAEMRRIVAQKSGSAVEALKTMLVQTIGSIYDSVQQKHLNDDELQRTKKQLHNRLKPFIDARLALIEELLTRAEAQQEIKALPNYNRTAQLIMLTLRGVRPPYPDNANRLQLQRDAADILDLVMNGIRLL